MPVWSLIVRRKASERSYNCCAAWRSPITRRQRPYWDRKSASCCGICEAMRERSASAGAIVARQSRARSSRYRARPRSVTASSFSAGGTEAELRQQRLLAFEQLQRLLVIAQADAQARDHAEQFGVGQRLAGQLALAAALACDQQLARIEDVALLGHAGVVEQADHEILHGLGARGFAHGLATLPDAGGQRGQQHAAGRAAEAPAPSDGGEAYLRRR